MALVDYSDSDASDSEQTEAQQLPPPPPSPTKPATTSTSSTAKLVDKANPAKIRVQLGGSHNHLPSSHGDEPAAKRPRTGGVFSGFNAQLPPPKRDADKGPPAASKPAARKVFSLKTGAEPAFSRESDSELRHFFAEQDSSRPDDAAPLSVARPKNSRTKLKKQPANGSVANGPVTTTAAASPSLTKPTEPLAPPAKKTSLFSLGEPLNIPDPELIAKGDQIQHNPVRAIAPGKHSLRQLVNAAQGQKDALEDSFAIGKQNKKEAGSKYGW
ncbi:hypothetical protein DV736_g2034, partial [Chaetothyriales sp. CBS 134916]